MPNNDNWDLDNIISEADQADVKRINLTSKDRMERARRFLCRIGIHRNSSWNMVQAIAFKAMNEGTGQTAQHDFELSMRCCFKCGRPGVRLRRI